MSAPHLLVTSLEGETTDFHAREGCQMKWAVGPFGELEVWQENIEEFAAVEGTMTVFNSLDWSTCEERVIAKLEAVG